MQIKKIETVEYDGMGFALNLSGRLFMFIIIHRWPNSESDNSREVIDRVESEMIESINNDWEVERQSIGAIINAKIDNQHSNFGEERIKIIDEWGKKYFITMDISRSYVLLNIESSTSPYFVYSLCNGIEMLQLCLPESKNIAVESTDLKHLSIEGVPNMLIAPFRTSYFLPRNLLFLTIDADNIRSTNDIVEPPLFPNLEAIEIINSKLQEFDVDKFLFVKYVILHNNKLTKFPNFGNLVLSRLKVSDNPIAVIDCTVNISADNGAMAEVEVGSEETEYVNMNFHILWNSKVSVDVVKGKNLKSVKIDGNRPINMAHLHGPKSIKTLDLRDIHAKYAYIGDAELDTLIIADHITSLHIGSSIIGNIVGGKNIEEIFISDVLKNYFEDGIHVISSSDKKRLFTSSSLDLRRVMSSVNLLVHLIKTSNRLRSIIAPYVPIPSAYLFDIAKYLQSINVIRIGVHYIEIKSILGVGEIVFDVLESITSGEDAIEFTKKVGLFPKFDAIKSAKTDEDKLRLMNAALRFFDPESSYLKRMFYKDDNDSRDIRRLKEIIMDKFIIPKVNGVVF